MRKIAFFDSGIGGLSVLQHAQAVMPNENFIYYADTKHVPYGTKTQEEVIGFAEEAVAFLAEQDLKALVVACNTATSVAIQGLREKYDFPILGMEPAVKPAVATSEKRVLVIATPMTIREKKMQYLLKQVDRDHMVDLLPLPRLVEFAEQDRYQDDSVVAYLKEMFTPFDMAQYGTLVLGCTHFNYFKEALRSVLPAEISFLDGCDGTIRHLMHTLQGDIVRDAQSTGSLTVYESGERQTDLVAYEKRLQWLSQMAKL